MKIDPFHPRHGRDRLWVFLAVVWIAAVAVISFGLGTVYARAGWAGWLKSAVQHVGELPAHWIGGMTARPVRLRIDIQYKEFQQLAFQRQQALARNVLVSAPGDFVPAALRIADETMNIQIRLKGDHIDHLEGDRWSFRVRVKGDQTVLGMKQFSLHRPQARGYLDEWLVQRALAREGLIALRYEFVHLTVNGKDMGVYALEEHFEKRLIENNRRREGPIVRFDESLYWEWHSTGENWQFFNAPVESYQTPQLLADPVMRPQLLRALSLLEGWRSGKLAAHEVFDVEQLAQFVALSDLFGATHGNIWHNKRFYFNPVTDRLEPIGFDMEASSEHPITGLIGSGQTGRDYLYPPHQALLFADPQFMAAYGRQLERVSRPDYLDALLAELGSDLRRRLNILYRDFPAYHFSTDTFYENQKRIRRDLYPVQGIRAHLRGIEDGRLVIETANIQSLPVEILHVTDGTKGRSTAAPPAVLTAPARDVLLEFVPVAFEMPPLGADADVAAVPWKIEYRTLGTDLVREQPVAPWPVLDPAWLTAHRALMEPNAESFEFLFVDAQSRKVVIRPGDWTLDRRLVTPRGFRLVARSGVRLNLTRSASIWCGGPLDWEGTEEEPVVLTSDDGTGGGLVVIQAGAPSRMKHATLSNLAAPAEPGLNVTSAVTFYESDVDIQRCQFVHSRSEDALNAIRGSFSIQDCLFRDTQSDAIDSDFCRADVRQSAFENLGNDALDVSGSRLTARDLSIRKAGDKGISVGENSTADIQNVSISESEIGIAAKDLSHVKIRASVIRDTQLGLTVYQKKPEYGPAVIETQDLKMENVKQPLLIEDRSEVVFEGRRMTSAEGDVKGMLYGARYGKASR